MAPDTQRTSAKAASAADVSIGGLVQRIAHDAQTLTRNELALAKLELNQAGERTAAGLATLLLGGVLALISLGLLCATAVVALAPLMHALWLRMLIMSLVYLCLGSLLVGVCALQLATTPVLPIARKEAAKTARTLKEELRDAR